MSDDQSPQIGGQSEDNAPGLSRLWEERRAKRGIDIRVNIAATGFRAAAAALDRLAASIGDFAHLSRDQENVIQQIGRLAPSVDASRLAQQFAETERHVSMIQIMLNLADEDAHDLYQRMRQRVVAAARERPISTSDLWDSAWGQASRMMAYGTFTEEAWQEWLG